jgi:hypothetical protein
LKPEDIQRLRTLQQEQPRTEPPLIFVQVTEPSQEVPPDTRFYSSASARAANPNPASANLPRIDGQQTKVIRTEDAPNLPTAKSAPPPQPQSEFTPQPLPPPTPVTEPEPVARAELPPLAEPVREPERQPGADELAMVQPVIKRTEPEPVPSVETRIESRIEPRVESAPVQPEPVKPAIAESSLRQPPRSRPRTLVEARLRQELLSGEKVKQEGGAPREGRVQFDVQGKSYGAYDEALVMAVKNRWFALLEARRFAGSASGWVIINFKLYSDGSVRIVEPTESTVDPLLDDFCIRAVRDPAPYGKWPREMLRDIGKPFREIRFTFYYN